MLEMINIVSWLDESIKWIMNSDNHNQISEGKNKYLQRGKYEKTRLRAVGISNGELKKYANKVKKDKKLDYDTVLKEFDQAVLKSPIIEVQLFYFYLIEKFKKSFTRTFFDKINRKLINNIDYWAIADHLCINIFGGFPLDDMNYYLEINNWRDSENYWRRRLSITSYLKLGRINPEIARHVIDNIEYLIEDKNYYVRKAFPWLLREITRKLPENRNEVYILAKRNISKLNKTELKDAIKYLGSEMKEELLELYES